MRFVWCFLTSDPQGVVLNWGWKCRISASSFWGFGWGIFGLNPLPDYLTWAPVCLLYLLIVLSFFYFLKSFSTQLIILLVLFPSFICAKVLEFTTLLCSHSKQIFKSTRRSLNTCTQKSCKSHDAAWAGQMQFSCGIFFLVGLINFSLTSGKSVHKMWTAAHIFPHFVHFLRGRFPC